MAAHDINWPPKYHPNSSDVHVVNNLEMDVSVDEAWNALIRAVDWPRWYPNAKNVRFLNSDKKTLELGTQFRWKTFGITIDCTVREFQPFERLSWSSDSPGISVYHGWHFTPQGERCHIITEETQQGIIPKAAQFLMPKRMHKFHQIWLEQLEEKAKSSRVLEIRL